MRRRSMSVRWRVLVAGIAVAAGCGRDDARSSSLDTARVAPAPSAAVASADPASAATVTARGIGALRAGMTLAEASSALAGALVIPAGADTAGCHYVAWRGGPAGVSVMVEGGRVARVDVKEPGTRTAAGVGVGDSEEQLQRAYGGAAVTTPQKYGEGHYVTVRDPADTASAIVFETAGGRVTRYRAGRRPQVEYVEGCG